MPTKEDMKALVGRQILVRVRAHQGPHFFYYFGTVRELLDYGVYLECLAEPHVNDRLPLFTKRTGIGIKPRTPGFFEFLGVQYLEVGTNFLYYSQFEILEVCEDRLW